MSVDLAELLAELTPAERSLFGTAMHFILSIRNAGRPVQPGHVVIVGARDAVEELLSVEIADGTRIVTVAPAAIFAKRVEAFGRACPCPDADACGRRARCNAIAAQIRADAGKIQVALVDDGCVSVIALADLCASDTNVNAPGGAA